MLLFYELLLVKTYCYVNFCFELSWLVHMAIKIEILAYTGSVGGYFRLDKKLYDSILIKNKWKITKNNDVFNNHQYRC